jgi:hypothetical protein
MRKMCKYEINRSVLDFREVAFIACRRGIAHSSLRMRVYLRSCSPRAGRAERSPYTCLEIEQTAKK